MNRTNIFFGESHSDWLPVRGGESGDFVFRRGDGHAFAKIAPASRRLTGAGIKRNRLVLDPGMGFFLGAAPETSLSVLARFDELRLRFDLPVLLSVSRKSFLRALTGRGPGDVGAATLAAELAAAAGGADFIRTHEPRPLRDGLAVLAALKETARIR
ncbi:dihydropteroate synthase [Escherichia coli]|nr:dihydropteroate synthase [Escherichia coli]